MTTDIEQTRKQFEEWALSQGYDILRDPKAEDDDYHFVSTDCAWLGWQAATARAEAAAHLIADSYAGLLAQVNKQ